jgi:hypothetical protein
MSPLACPLHQESESGDCPDCLERLQTINLWVQSRQSDVPRYFNRAAFDALCRMDAKAKQTRRAYYRRYLEKFYGISQ